MPWPPVLRRSTVGMKRSKDSDLGFGGVGFALGLPEYGLGVWVGTGGAGLCGFRILGLTMKVAEFGCKRFGSGFDF